MEQRIEFGLKALQTDNFARCVRNMGISPKTGYKCGSGCCAMDWLGWREQSRRPGVMPMSWPKE